MRSVIRPALVGIAAIGMVFAGAASSQACGKHAEPTTKVTVVKKKKINDSFNDFFSHNFTANNNNVVFGDQNIGNTVGA
ncbi:MAG: hypothetical protein ACRDP3_26385 [Streptomyces sp.]|uniref:hypothetical protein n=1 Tax=Streptomyces sp. TaxID=1931 RepID=UPI003D6B1124